MQYAEGRPGRVFTLRLESGDRLPESIETFAEEHGIASASCILLGGADGGRLVVGPRDGAKLPPIPIMFDIEGAHEVAALGTIFANEEGKPKLHMHAALGRDGQTATGCVRPGVDIWLVGEVVIHEIVDSGMKRAKDEASGLELLTRTE